MLEITMQGEGFPPGERWLPDVAALWWDLVRTCLVVRGEGVVQKHEASQRPHTSDDPVDCGGSVEHGICDDVFPVVRLERTLGHRREAKTDVRFDHEWEDLVPS